MAPKRPASKVTTESKNWEVLESMPLKFLVYSYTQKESNITWQKVNEAFSARSLKVDLEDWQVYINVQKLGLHKVACKYRVFPCADNVS